jgi:hypothetical protein
MYTYDNQGNKVRSQTMPKMPVQPIRANMPQIQPKTRENYKISNQTRENYSDQNKKSVWLWIGLGVAIAVILLIIFLAFYYRAKPSATIPQSGSSKSTLMGFGCNSPPAPSSHFGFRFL